MLPFFGSLCRWISPPSSLAISRLMDSPRPVPPYLRAVEPSACWNASKMMRCLSFGMPMPVSVTEKASTCRERLSTSWSNRFSRSASATFILTLPSSVNLKALDRRFFSTCCRRCGSVRMCRGVPGATSTEKASPFWSATGRKARSMNWLSSARTMSRGSTCIFPASTLERSRISLMRLSRSPPDA